MAYNQSKIRIVKNNVKSTNFKPLPITTATTTTRTAMNHDKVIRLVLFSWDDTLCPTTSIFKATQKTNLTFTQIQNLGIQIYKLLSQFITEFGADHVYIVTNGATQWISNSLKVLSKKYQQLKPSYNDPAADYIDIFDDPFALILNSWILGRKINIFSAQDWCNANHSKSRQQPAIAMTTEWKSFTFKSIVKTYIDNTKHNISSFTIISIGDCLDEYLASFVVKQWIKAHHTNKIKNVLLHRIKLTARPTISCMMHEFEFLLSWLASFQNDVNDTKWSTTKREWNIDYEQE